MKELIRQFNLASAISFGVGFIIAGTIFAKMSFEFGLMASVGFIFFGIVAHYIIKHGKEK